MLLRFTPELHTKRVGLPDLNYRLRQNPWCEEIKNHVHSDSDHFFELEIFFTKCIHGCQK